MSSFLASMLRKYAQIQLSTDTPDTIQGFEELIVFFSLFYFQSPEKDDQDRFFYSLISNINYSKFCNMVVNLDIDEQKRKEMIQSIINHLLRFFLAVNFNLINQVEKPCEIDNLIICLSLVNPPDFLPIFKDLIQNYFQMDLVATAKPVFVTNAESIVRGIIAFYSDPENIPNQIKEDIFKLATRVLVCKMKFEYVEKIDLYFNYFFKNSISYPQDKYTIECVLNYAYFSCRNHDFLVPDKKCEHFMFKDCQIQELFVRENLFEEGPFVEEKLANSEMRLSRMVSTIFSEIMPVLNAAEKLYINDPKFINELAKRVAGDATYFWRFFLTSLMLYFKDDPKYINNEKLSPISRMFDLRLISDGEHNDTPLNVINSALVTLAVNAHLIEPTLILLKSNCPYEALQGVDIFHGMVFKTSTWFDELSEAQPILTELSQLFTRTFNALLKHEANETDTKIFRRIRSSILHIFLQLSQKKYKMYESKGFADIIFPLFFEEKPQNVAMSILRVWSLPTPSILFYKAVESYMRRCLMHLPDKDWAFLFHQIYDITLSTYDNASIDVLAHTSFYEVFNLLSQSDFAMEAAKILQLCVFSEIPDDLTSVESFLFNYFTKEYDPILILNLSKMSSIFNAEVLHACHILDLLLETISDDCNDVLIQIYANVALSKFTETDARKLAFKSIGERLNSSICSMINFMIPQNYDSIASTSQRKKFELPSVENFNLSIRFDRVNVYNFANVSTSAFIRFSIIEREIEIFAVSGNISIRLRYQGEKQNNYPTPLKIVSSFWHQFKISIQKNNLKLKIDEQQTFSLDFPKKFVFAPDEGNVIVNIFPNSVQASTPVSPKVDSTYMLSMINALPHDSPLLSDVSFIIASIYQNPLSSDYFEYLPHVLLNISEEDRFKALQRFPISERTAFVLFDYNILSSFSIDNLVNLLRFYVEKNNADMWMTLGKKMKLSNIVFNVERCFYPNVHPAFYDFLFGIAKNSLGSDVHKILIYYGTNPTDEYFMFIERCINEIPNFSADFTADNALKFFLNIIFSKGDEITSIRCLDILHMLLFKLKKQIEIPPSFLILCQNSDFKEKIIEKSFFCLLNSPNNESLFIPSFFPIYAILVDEKGAHAIYPYLLRYAEQLLQCPNWVFWVLLLATLDKKSHWHQIFTRALTNQDKDQICIWLTFLTKIIYFFDVDAEQILSEVFQTALSLQPCTEVVTFVFAFLMYDCSNTARISPLEVTSLIANSTPYDQIFDLENRVIRFKNLTFSAASSLLSIPPKVYAKLGSVSNMRTSAFLSDLLFPVMPQDSVILFERAYTLAEKFSEEELKMCIEAAGKNLSQNKSIKHLFEANPSTSTNLETIKVSIDESFSHVMATRQQTKPLVDFDRFCILISEGTEIINLALKEFILDFDKDRIGPNTVLF